VSPRAQLVFVSVRPTGTVKMLFNSPRMYPTLRPCGPTSGLDRLGNLLPKLSLRVLSTQNHGLKVFCQDYLSLVSG